LFSPQRRSTLLSAGFERKAPRAHSSVKNACMPRFFRRAVSERQTTRKLATNPSNLFVRSSGNWESAPIGNLTAWTGKIRKAQQDFDIWQVSVSTRLCLTQ
jgi:hypothetical protein